MISKPSTRADELLEANELIARAMAHGPSDRLRKKMLAHRRGIIGEKETAHILDRLFFDSKDHMVIHDLRIPDGIGSFAQFDHIILSRLSRKASVVEVKNYSGRMSRNKHDEWVVWYEGRRRPVQIPNPVAQARRQRDVLRAWLKTHDHDKVFSEVGTFVVIPADGQIDRTKITRRCRSTRSTTSTGPGWSSPASARSASFSRAVCPAALLQPSARSLQPRTSRTSKPWRSASA